MAPRAIARTTWASWRRLARLALIAFVLCVQTRSVAAQPSAQPAASTAAWSVAVRNWTRVEMWSFFEPPPGGGDPTYADVANRLQVTARWTRPRVEIAGALQYVQFGGLPTDATGPGSLGTGALYYVHSGRSDSRQAYLRYLYARVKEVAPGLSLQVGRMGYTSGAEAPSGDTPVELVKRLRLDSRLIGEFEWSMFQRGFDGIRTDWDRSHWRITAHVLRPTQGGFEDAAGLQIGRINIIGATVNAQPGRLIRHSDVQLFGHYYTDRRRVQGRPDNSGLTAARVDATITSFGGALVGAYPNQRGTTDTLVWVVGQTGSWYDDTHRAYAVAAEAGHQWTAAPFRPWVRAGLSRASGDRDPRDRRHGTFFQMLPTVRRYSLSTLYSLMNLNDVFGQVIVRPAPPLTVRLDAHRVTLASAADRWYAGSGATQASGSIFGYTVRPSNGATGLATLVEGSADYVLTPHWSVNGYLGWARGGDVVRRSFAGNNLAFAYVENVIQF
jgi:hypothetical protein